MAWRDGMPATYEPLLPIGSFGAHAPGLPFLAGDMALLSGLAPHRAVLMVALASFGLLVGRDRGLLDRAWRPRLGPPRPRRGALDPARSRGRTRPARSRGPGGLPWPPRPRPARSGFGPLARRGRRSAPGRRVHGAGARGSCLAPWPPASSEPGRGGSWPWSSASSWPLRGSGSASRGQPGRGAGHGPSELGELLPRREAVPDAFGLRAMAWVREHTGPLEARLRRCGRGGPRSSGRGRTAILPPEVARGVSRKKPGRPGATCRFAILFGPFDPLAVAADPASPAFAPAAATPVFDAGSVRVLASR